MSMTEDLLKNDIKLAKGITDVANSISKAIVILSTAILELEDPEGKHFLKNRAPSKRDCAADSGEGWLT